MQSILGLLFLCGAIYSVIAASGIHQYIGDGSDEKLAWSDSAHNADTDEILSRVAAFDGATNFDDSHWGGDAPSRGGGSDRASHSDSGFQFIQF
ncbi:GL24776 [Drosophila persimilis]|uniref:GL24776 n=1 Tax=Drosophila persimilis TaxID=7234 RepID=B4H8V3_DROPE|nr:GL24776 [Drosophila persimilis]